MILIFYYIDWDVKIFDWIMNFIRDIYMYNSNSVNVSMLLKYVNIMVVVY